MSRPGLVTFRAAGKLWAVPVDDVLEIVRIGAVTPVPGTSARVAGVVGWRGRTIPVLSLQDDLKPEAPAPDQMTRVLVLARPGPFGLLIERPERVLAPGEWQPAKRENGKEPGEPPGPGARLACFEGGILRVLDPVRWIGSKRDLLRGLTPDEATEVPR